MMTLPVLDRKPISPFIRYPALLLRSAAIRPFWWLMGKMGRQAPILIKMGQRIGLNDRVLQAFSGYEPTAHDIFVCVYSKSGTNWMMQIAHQIATRGQGEFAHIHDVIPWPDQPMPGYSLALNDGRVQAASPTGLRVIKTHLPREYVPFTDNGRYICVVRDPKDAFVSSYHFVRDVMFGPMMPSVDVWGQFFVSGNFMLGSWAEQVAGWWAEGHRDNVLCLTFAEMKQDLPTTVRRIADFMKVTLTTAEFEGICQKSSFNHMRSIDHKFFPNNITPWTNNGGKMMRKGEHGRSSEMLSAAHQRQIDEFCRAELRQLNSDFPYDKMFINP
jgi:hypothetical protein